MTSRRDSLDALEPLVGVWRLEAVFKIIATLPRLTATARTGTFG